MGHPPRLMGTALACLFLFFAVAESAPRPTCVTGCRGMHQSKAYQEGRTYVYNLEGLSVTSITDAQGDASLKLSATVELSVKPDCINQLRLKNVKINGAPPLIPEIEQYAVQFNYHDGHIDTQLCTEPGDSQASLNIKRAVVSMFQSAIMQDSGSTIHHEIDVMGTCPTEFNFRKEGDSLIVNKNRNLASCAFRENVNQGLVSGNTDAEAGVKSSPLLGSQQSIEQRFKRGILNKAVSKEQYTLRPFSNGHAGANTNVETTLTLKSEKADNPTVTVSQPKSIIFESPQPVLRSSADAVANALKSTRAEVAGGVKPDAASRFADLVKVLRVSGKNDIMSVYQKVRSGDKEDQKLFLDALFRARTGEAAEVGVELIKNKELTNVQTLLFYAGSLALIRHVHLPSVTAIASLLDQPDLPRLGYLGVGQVIGRYCQQNSCENVAEIKQAVHKIREKVGNGKAKSREQENSIISALKALGNSQFLDDATLQKLANIAADKNVRNRVRVAAIQALPTRCSMKWKNVMFKVLADREEDSEIRINTYLSLVACPCPHAANQLKEVLDKETVNQVGSFIQTHLRNLRASTDPDKLNAKNQFGLIKPRVKFPEDFRKYSFNNELSYKIDSLGLGSTLDSNVVYSQNSFVPRSANLNMTVELFGKNFNFLELNTRVENLDRLLEHYLGPKGKIWEKDLEEDLKSGANEVNKLRKYARERFEKVVRGKREVRQGDLDRFAKNVHLRSNEVDQDLDIDLSVKLFGVEYAYLSYQGEGSKLSPEAVIDKLLDGLEKGFDVTKNLKSDLENYLQFLDNELVYPTNLGTALSLGLSGTSALRLKTQGKFDLKSALKDPKNTNFRLAVEPSVSIRLAGSMTVQAPGVESGMKIIGTLHTSTSTDVSVSLLDGTGIDVNIGIPKKKQEVISVSSEVLFSTPKGDVAPKFGKSKEYADCFEQFSSYLGLTVCGKISYPYDDSSSIDQKPLFPLNGPAEFAVKVENNDVNKYHFKIFANNNAEANKRSFEILLDTPNSKMNRRMALLLESSMQHPNMYVKGSLDTPFKKASAEAVLKDTAQERTLTVTVKHDQMEYYGRVGVLASGSKYKPIMEYKVPEHIEKLASSKTGLPPGQQYYLDGSVDVTDNQDGKKFNLEKVAFVLNGQKLIVIDGPVTWTSNSVNVDTNIGYGDKNLAFKLDGQCSKDDHRLVVSAMPSSDPNIGFNLNWQLKKTDNNLENKFYFVHGPDPNSQTNRLSLTQKAVYKLNNKEFFLSVSNELTYPIVNLKLKYEGELIQKSVSSDLEFKYKEFNFGTELSAKVGTEKPGDYEVEFEAQLMENGIELKAKRKILDGQKSQFSNSLELKPGGKYTADAVVLYSIASKSNINFELDGDANLNGKKVKINTALESNPQSFNALLNAKVNDVTYVEFDLKNKRSPNPSGVLVLNLKNYLTANGQYSYQNGKGNAKLDIDVPKIDRKIQATGSLTVSGSKHVGELVLLYDAAKDPNKRVKLSTTSDITKTSVDTKNILEVVDKRLELNGKGSMQGTLNNGQLEVEMDVTLPNGRHLVYKGKRNSVKKDTKYDIQVASKLTDYEQKGGPSRSLSYNGNVQDLDVNAITFQGNGQLKFVNKNGNDVQISVIGKNLNLPDNKKQREVNIELGGSSIPKKLQFQYRNQGSDNEGSHNVKSSFGDDVSLMSNVNMRKGNNIDKPYKVDGVFDMKLPSENLKNLKLELVSSLLDSDEKDLFKSSGAVKLTYNNDRKIELSKELELIGMNKNLEGPSEGKGKLNMNILDLSPVQLSGSYKYDPTPEKKSATLVLDGQYGSKTFSLRSDNVYLPSVATVTLKAKGNLKFEKLDNVDLQLLYKRFKDENKLIINSQIDADGAKHSLVSEIQYLDSNNLFYVMTVCPTGKTEILSKFQKLNDKEYKGEWKVDTPKGFAKADAHVNLESVDNFVIKANFDSDKAKHRNIHAEIANQPTAKNGKSISITVTSDGKNIVTGSTSYKHRDEDGKIVVEGSGNLKVGDNTRSSSFKYTRQRLTHEKDGEAGVAIVLNANLGPSAIVGELKLSNKELHLFNSYCEQNKDCAQFKLQSILNVEKKTLLKHQVTVEVDLKKFNVPVEFGLKTNTEFKNPIFDHTTNLYLHSSKDKTEYTYQAYIHPKEAATILTLPSREVALILIYDVPKTRQTAAYKLDVSLYLDRKNKPSEKTSLSAIGDINVDKNSLSLSGETKFTYPTQHKDMSMKGYLHYGGDKLLDANLDIDVFAKRSQKISIVANVQRQQIPNGQNVTSLVEVNSRGQQLKLDLKSHLAISKKQIGFGTFFTYNNVKQKPKTLGALYSADLNHVSLLITLPDKQLIRDNWKFDITRNTQKVHRELSLLDNTPQVLNFEANDFNRFKLETYLKNNPNNKAVLNGQMVLGQLAEIHAHWFKDGVKKHLFHALVNLDEKQFLKPDFGYNTENIAELGKVIKNKNLDVIKDAKDVYGYVLDETSAEGSDFVDHLVKAKPSFQSLVEYYEKELNKLKEEMNADETIQEIQVTLRKYFGTLFEILTETMKRIAHGLEKLKESLNNLISNVKQAVNSMYPKLKESYDKIFHQMLEILDAVIKLANTYLQAVLNLINEHQKEIKDMLNVISGMSQDIVKILFKGLEQIKLNLDQFCHLLINQLKALPAYETIKERLEELKNFQIPDNILNSLEELCKLGKNILPTEELRHFVDITCEYIIKLVKRQKINDMNELKKIYSSLVAAVQSIVALAQKQSSLENIWGLISIQTPDLGLLSKLPTISALKLSVWNLLRNRELPTLEDLYYTYRPTPLFRKSGVVTDGGHFFTFDGRHLTMAGSCTYILAQDMQDGNFSVVANFNNGILISVTLTEPKESIAIKNNGNILVNNKPADYPAHTKNLHAYLFPPYGNIKSDYGVRVSCTSKAPMICAVHVSGFYHGKLRGILGDANNEPYDDYTLPSGKITESGTEFGNAYKLKSECPEATAVEQHNERTPVCTDYFTGENSPLKSCFNIVKPSLYRDACDHAIAAGTPAGACIIAMAYHYACYAQGVMSTYIPSSCTNCKVGGNKIDMGDSFSVKVPKKEADVIFVIEQQIPNDKVYKEMITPLMSELREELKQQGVTDVHIGLIGYSEMMKWPQHFTLNGDTNIDGEVKNMKFEEGKPIISYQEAKEGNTEKKIDYLHQRMDVELGTFKLTDAYEAAIRYPFRPGAARAVVGVIANPCEKSPFPISLQQLRLLLGLKIYRDLGLTYYHVSYPKELLVSGKPQKNIVAYDQDNVYTFADSKKKPLTGSTDMKSNLVPAIKDVCADFAVFSGGAAFSSNNFLDAKSNQKKQFVQVAAKRIADSLVNVEFEKDCSCLYEYGMIGRSKCKIVGRKEVPRSAKGGTKG